MASPKPSASGRWITPVPNSSSLSLLSQKTTKAASPKGTQKVFRFTHMTCTHNTYCKDLRKFTQPLRQVRDQAHLAWTLALVAAPVSCPVAFSNSCTRICACVCWKTLRFLCQKVWQLIFCNQRTLKNSMIKEILKSPKNIF